MDVKILIKTNITYDNGINELVKNQYKGKFYIRDSDCYLRYEENPDQEMGNTSTIIRWSNVQVPERVLLIRQGKIKMKQIFQEGYKDNNDYTGPFGTINLEIITNHIQISKSQNNGKIFLDYNLKLNNQINGNYVLEIDYFNQ